MAYLNMRSRVDFRDIYTLSVAEIEIKKSITSISDTATIQLPKNYALLDGKFVLDYITVGDPVTIQFGYEETGINTEFTGYVSGISSDIPIEISCDSVYPLRQNNFVMSYKAVTLSQLLKDVTAGTFITNIDCPDVALGKYLVDNASTYRVLEKIKEELGLYVRVDKNTLTLGFAWDWRPNTRNHVYTIQQNVKKNDLRYRRKDQYRARVRVKIRTKDGKSEYIEAGSKDDNASVTTINYAASTAAEAKKIAEARLKKVVYDGYTGSVSGFGFPVTNAGDSLTIKDAREPYREGTYLVEKNTVTYSPDGITRKNELAFKV